MPTIQQASLPVTSFPNEYSSPFANDEIVPLYSSVPLKSPIQGCLPCVVCGNSIVRQEVISNSGFSKPSFNGVNIVTKPNSPVPGVPTNLQGSLLISPTASSCPSSNFNLSWEPPKYTGTSPIQYYVVYDHGVYAAVQFDGSATSGSINLDVTQSHVITLTAVNGSGQGAPSNSYSFGGSVATQTWTNGGDGSHLGLIATNTFTNPLGRSGYLLVCGGVDDEATVNNISTTNNVLVGPDLTATAHGISTIIPVASGAVTTISQYNNYYSNTSIDVTLYYL